MLESLISAENAEKRPYILFFLGILYSSVAILLSLWLFKGQSSILMITLTVFASIPLIYKSIILEEKKDEDIQEERLLIKEHSKALSFFMFLFLGFIVSFSLWYIFSPDAIIKDLFSTQIETLQDVNTDTKITGYAINTSGAFMQIFFTNFKILLFTILFSFFYGAGAIFILTWNASIISTAIGNFVRESISKYATNIGYIGIGNYFHAFSIGLLKYLTHGIFEISAFFIGGLAGGIISVAVIKHEMFHKRFKHIVIDSVDLVVLAIIVLFVATLIEVFVTPVIF